MSFNSHLVTAIVDLAVFLEYTGEEHLDPDTAIQALEQLAAELQLMLEADRQLLAKQIIALSAAYAHPEKEFVENLPEALGLI